MSEVPNAKGLSKAGFVSLHLSVPCIFFAFAYIAGMVDSVLHGRRHKLVEDGMEFTLMSMTLFGPLTVLALIFGAFAGARRALCLTVALVFPVLFDIYFIVEYVLGY